MDQEPDRDEAAQIAKQQLLELRAIAAEIEGLREDLRQSRLNRYPISVIAFGVFVGMVISTIASFVFVSMQL